MKKAILFSTLAALLPTTFARAQSIEDIVDTITAILRRVLPALFLIATIVFIWGVIIYITAGGSEDKSKKGKTYILWGLIGLTVMVAVWGIVLAITNTFNLTNVRAPGIPDIPGF